MKFSQCVSVVMGVSAVVSWAIAAMVANGVTILSTVLITYFAYRNFN
jgi:tRNA A37 threonylcarbamoyladenosine dehydratase